MILYGYYRSSASYRVRIILNYKNITHKHSPVHLINNGGEHKSENYKKINSFQQVPSLVHGEHKITQSMAIAQYLEDICPKPALIPSNKLEKAYVLQICEIINSGTQPMHNLSLLQKIKSDFNVSDTQEWCQFWINKSLISLEKILSQRSQKFALNNEISLADIFIVPQIYSLYRFGLNLDNFPLLKNIEDNTKNIKAFADAHPSRHQTD